MEFHGLDCLCCKDKTPKVDEILLEMNKILGDASETTSSNTILQLDSLNKSEFGGEIDDIIQLGSTDI